MVGPPLRCEFARCDERVIVGVHGEVDLATAPVLEREIVPIISPELGGLVVDLAYCTFLDSRGVGALLRLHERAQMLGVPFRLTSIPRAVELALTTSGLASTFGLASTSVRRARPIAG